MSKAFPLVMAAIGERVQLERINGGEKIIRRLTALGLTPGIDLSIVQDAGGPLLVSFRDSRIALGRGMAQKVMVSLRDDNEINKGKEK